jgi:protein hfq
MVYKHAISTIVPARAVSVQHDGNSNKPALQQVETTAPAAE